MTIEPRTTRKRAQPNSAPHPLEPIVLKAFEERPHQDGASLGYYLAGAFVPGGSKAYATVARDVLGYMEDQGKLTRDELGWWVRVAT